MNINITNIKAAINILSFSHDLNYCKLTTGSLKGRYERVREIN